MIEQHLIPTCFKFFLIITPIWFMGTSLVFIATQCKKIELLLTSGLIVGFSFLIFTLNMLSFLFPGPPALIISAFIILGFNLNFVKLLLNKKLHGFYFSNKLLFILSILIWSFYLFHRAGYTNFGGDTAMFYAIAQTFIRGNFPIVSPWQPDLAVNYHYGSYLILGFVKYFTNISFDFISRFTNFLLLLCSTQLLVWMFKSHKTIKSLLPYQLLPLFFFVNLGTLMLIWPIFPFNIPPFQSLAEFLNWISQLPQIAISFDTWGSPTLIDHLFYFSHQGVGISIFITTIFIALNYINKLNYYFLLIITLSALSITNETYFGVGFVADFLIIIFHIYRKGLFPKEKGRLLLSVLAIIIIIFFQGGIISSSTVGNSVIKNTIIFFPKQEDFAERWGYTVVDINKYHLDQIRSKLFPDNPLWRPFRWFHPGIIQLSVLALFLITLLYFSKLNNKIIVPASFFIAVIFSVAVYFLVVPRYIYSSTSRLLIIAYQLLTFILIFCSLNLYEKWQDKFNIFFKVVLFIGAFIILTPSILPSLFSFTTKSNQPHALMNPSPIYHSNTFEWLKKNSNVREKYLDLITGSYYTPHGSYNQPRSYLQPMIEVGLMTPYLKLGSAYRSIQPEPGPDYFDAIYTLNPSALKKMGINKIILDDSTFEWLPKKRKEDITNTRFFAPIYKDYEDTYHERIYQILPPYFDEGEELGGTLSELDKIIPAKANIYLSDRDRYEANVVVHLYRVITLTLKDRNIYRKDVKTVKLLGTFYMGMETLIRIDDPSKISKFDFLIYYSGDDPSKICNCQAKLIWTGLNKQIFVWKVI